MIRHLTVSLRDGRVTGLFTYDFGTVTRTVHPRAGASCAGVTVTALFPRASLAGLGEDRRITAYSSLNAQEPDGGSPHPDGDGRPQGMSGRPVDFSRQGPGAGTARDHGIRFTREPAGNAAAVEEQLDAHPGQCGGLRQRSAAQRSPTPRRGSKHSEDSAPGRTGTGPRQGAPGSKPVFYRHRPGPEPPPGGSCCTTATPSSTWPKTPTWT
jgi:hypothetical protein